MARTRPCPFDRSFARRRRLAFGGIRGGSSVKAQASMKTRRRTLAIAAVLLCRALAAESAVPPLPPLPDTLPTDQFAVDTTVPVAASTEPSDAAAQDSAWL